MRDLATVDSLDAASALLHPLRLSLLRRLAAPRTCTELGTAVGETPQKVHYHVKKLERHGLVDKVAERRVKGILEGMYRARARSYWLAPELIGAVGGPRASRDQLSLGFLVDLADDLRSDIAALARRVEAAAAEAEPPEVATLGLSAQVELAPGDRAAFLEDLQTAVQQLAETYGHTGNAKGDSDPEAPERFQLTVAVYPKPRPAPEPEDQPS